MKKLIPLLVILCCFAACSAKDDSDKKEKTTKEKKVFNTDNEEIADEDKEKKSSDDADDSEGWTSSQKKKGSKKYVQLIETENNSIYEKNSEQSVKKLADCMIEKIAERMSFSEYETIMENFAADKKVSDLPLALQRKSKSINPFFKRCSEDAGVEY